MTENKKWLSRREFTQLLSISLSSVDRGIKNNTWPFNKRVKIGGRVLFPASILTEMEYEAKKGVTVGGAAE